MRTKLGGLTFTTNFDSALSKGAEIGVFVIAAILAVTATVEITARNKAKDLIQSEQKRVLAELVHVERAGDAVAQLPRRAQLAERARRLEELEDSLEILSVNGSLEQNRLGRILDEALSERELTGVSDSLQGQPAQPLAAAAAEQATSSMAPPRSSSLVSISAANAIPNAGSPRAREAKRVDDLSRSFLAPWIATAILPQRTIERLPSDLLTAVAVTMCGVLGACIAALRTGRRQTFRNVLLGIGTGLIVFIGLRGGRTVFLLESGSSETVINPYSSCFVALLAGVYSERTFAILTAIVDKAARKAQGEAPETSA